jgi:hypothetical protein
MEENKGKDESDKIDPEKSISGQPCPKKEDEHMKEPDAVVPDE